MDFIQLKIYIINKSIMLVNVLISFSDMLKKFVFLLFLVLTSQSEAQNWDIELLRNINSPETLPSDGFFRVVSNSDAYIALGIPAGMALTGLAKHNETLLRNACVTFAAIGVNTVVTSVLKYTIDRDRPFITYSDITKKSAAGSPAFPSGHTSIAFATATSLSLDYPKWYIIVPSYAWAGTVGYSRMHLGVHYPSDVLAGAIVGAGSAWLTHAVNKKLNIKCKKRP
jgi:membrane-associated phospholipid phosphatase